MKKRSTVGYKKDATVFGAVTCTYVTIIDLHDGDWKPSRW